MMTLSGATAGPDRFRWRPVAGPVLLLILILLLSGCASTGDGADLGGGPDLADIEDAVPKAEPKSRYGNPKSYVVFGKRYYTKASADGHVERGLASWYGKKFHGRKTSSGERYDMHAMTAAHKSLPLPTYVQVTNLKNGRSAVVRVNDRGPFHGRRVIDLSYAAARKLDIVRAGTAMVEVRAIDPRKPDGRDDADNLFLAGEPDAAGKAGAKATAAAAKAKRAAQPREEPAIQIASVSPRPKASAQPKAKPADPPRPVVAAAAPAEKASSASAVYLQVGAFGSRTNAEQLRRQLVDQLAENVLVRAADGSKAPLYRVHVGPLDSRGKANDVSEKLASLGLTRSMVVEE
jgi:rare lipoprotein A